MVVFYLRNSRNPDSKIVPVTVSLNLDVVPGQNVTASGSGFPNLVDLEGEQVWVLTLSTRENDISGNPILPEVINVISEDTVHLEMEAALGRIGQQVDWGTLLPDDKAPQLIEITPPLNKTTNVSILSNIIIRLKDPLPAAGMDLSTLNMTINTVPIISGGLVVSPANIEIKGNVFDLTIIHRPKRIL